MSTRDAERWDIHSFRPPPSFPSLPPSLHSLLGLIGAECSCSGNRKERGRGHPHLSVGGREGKGRRAPSSAIATTPTTHLSHRDNDENVLHRPIHMNNAEIQFLKEPRAGISCFSVIIHQSSSVADFIC